MSEDFTFQNPLMEEDHAEEHLAVGEFLKSIIYGGVDGTVNTTIIVLSGVSSNTPLHNIFAIAIAAIVAGALDMACCDYVSAKAEMAYIKKEEDRQIYEVREMLQEEKSEIITIYTEKGYNLEDCIRLADLYSTNQCAFVNIMMLEQLQLVSIKDEAFPFKCGLATLVSFSLFGFITISPYIIGQVVGFNQIELWPFVIGIAAIELSSLGFAKSVILRINRIKSILQILLMGAIATGVGYGIGLLFPANQ